MSSELVSFVNLVVMILSLLIIARALFSWFDPGLQSQVGRILREVTEPIIAPVRQVMPSFGAFDISPIVALLLLQLVGRLITSLVG